MELSQQVFADLEKRIGRSHLSKRLRLQVEHSATRFDGNLFRIQSENAKPVYTILRYLLKALGLLRRGSSNALTYKTKKIRKRFDNLPESFRGLRLLHLSDIHIDGLTDKGEGLMAEIKKTDFDLCVITGDFLFRTFHDDGESFAQMEKLVDSLECEHGIFGILGNHDFIETVPQLEAMGIKILLNEAEKINKRGEHIWIVGVDDPSVFHAHDLKKGLQQVPHDAFKILLAHSPELFNDAAFLLFDYYLCGHTHGGQICLPGGIPIITNSTSPRGHVAGPWKYKRMEGYTSAGTGTSGLNVRFFCPPEITIHYFM